MKKKQWMEKAIRYDMLKQLYQGDALTAKALKAVFEDAEPVADDVKKSVAGKSEKEIVKCEKRSKSRSEGRFAGSGSCD